MPQFCQSARSLRIPTRLDQFQYPVLASPIRTDVTRTLPQGQSYSAARTALDWYAAVSRLGVDVDIVGPHGDLSAYQLILVPDLMIADPELVARLAASPAKVVIGPRAGSKTADMHIPANLPPGPLAGLIDLSVLRVESLPAFHGETVIYGNQAYAAAAWRETIRTSETVLAHFESAYRDGAPALVGNDKARYLTTVPETALVNTLLADTLEWAGVAKLPDLDDLRLARRGALRFAFNFGPTAITLPDNASRTYLVGSADLPPAGVSIWI